MSVSITDEKRALSKDEYELVEKSHYPALDQLSTDELSDIAGRLRKARDKARDLARQQRREQRGKAAPRGASAAEGNTGQTYKKQIFASALKRVNRRINRIKTDDKRNAHIAAAQAALGRKQEAMPRGRRPSSGRTAAKGMNPVTSKKRTVKNNPAEKGRVSQFVKQGQAKRDK